MSSAVYKPKVKKKPFDDLNHFPGLKTKNIKLFQNEEDFLEEAEELTIYELQEKLILYVKKKKFKVVSQILRNYEIPVNYTDSTKSAPLHYAVYYGLNNIVSVLLYYGADSLYINGYDETASECGEESIKNNIKSGKYIANNANIQNCLDTILNFKGRVTNTQECKHIKNVREILNKLQEENKDKLKLGLVKQLNFIMTDIKKIDEIFRIIFRMAEDNDRFLNVYVDVCSWILELDKSFDKRCGDYLTRIVWEKYEKSLDKPDNICNNNIIKFIVHFFIHEKKLMGNVLMHRLIIDLFEVIETNVKKEDNGEIIFKQQECIRLLTIILNLTIDKFDKQTNCKYFTRLNKFTEPEKNIKVRLKFMINDYEEKLREQNML